MAQSLQQLNEQIAKLQALAETARKKEIGEVLANIKTAVAQYGLKPSDIFPSSNGTRKRAGKRGSVKYRDGANTWTGHGRRPQWFMDAVKAGKKPEDLAV